MLGDRLPFADGGVDEVKQVGIAVDRKPYEFVSLTDAQQVSMTSTYRFAALAVSMTLPPPTARKWLKSCSLAQAMASRQLSSVGSVTTLSYTSNGRSLSADSDSNA